MQSDHNVSPKGLEQNHNYLFFNEVLSTEVRSQAREKSEDY